MNTYSVFAVDENDELCGPVLFTGGYDACVRYMRNQWYSFGTKLDLRSDSTGRLASYVF